MPMATAMLLPLPLLPWTPHGSSAASAHHLARHPGSPQAARQVATGLGQPSSSQEGTWSAWVSGGAEGTLVKESNIISVV